jgi:hypothetical protein
MNLLSKETLIGAASLGAGAVAAKIVHNKVLPLVPLDIVNSNDNVKNLITLGLGILTPVAIKSNIGRGLGAGMIAVSVAGLVSPLLPANVGVTGTNNYMGDVLMGEAESGTLMGASDNTFTAPTYDFTAGDAGEMDY